MSDPIYKGEGLVAEEMEPPARLRHVIDGGARVRITREAVIVSDSQGQELIRVNTWRDKYDSYAPLEIMVGHYDDPMRLDVLALERLPAALAYLSGESNLPT